MTQVGGPGKGLWLRAYAGGALTLLALDAVWLGWLMPDFYRSQIGALMLATPLWGAAAVFYLLYPVGITVFAVVPGLAAGRLSRAIVLSGLFGLLAYGTYDVSNLATLRGWSVLLSVVDIAWGAAASALAGAAGCWAARHPALASRA